MSSKQALFFRVFAAVLVFVVITASVITFILPETFASKALVNMEEKHTMGHLDEFGSPKAALFQETDFQKLLVNELLAKNWFRPIDRAASLSRSEMSRLVEKSFRAKAVEDSPIIEIEAFATTPQAAADLANAIAETYQRYRVQTAKELRAETTNAWKKKLDEGEQETKGLREKLSQLDPAKTDGQLEYSKVKRRLEELERFNEVLNRKLSEAPAEESSSPEPEHFIVKPAVPDLRPVRPNKPLNLGLGIILGTIAGVLTGIGAVAVRKPTL